MNWDEIIGDLLEIALNAGKAIMEVYNSEDFQVALKGDQSPLTKADRISNQIICNALQLLTPEIPIISEENKDVPFEERKKFEKFWLIDPLDGTKEFIKRNGEFTVNIALVEGNEVIGGVVYIPVKGTLYHAYKNKGAFKVEKEKNDKLNAAKLSESMSELRIVSSRSHMNDSTKEFLSRLNNPVLVSRGSSLKFLIISEGEADIYPRLAPTMEWDTAAAQIILEESGGSVINYSSGDKLKYNKESLLNPHFIAYGAR